MRSESRVAPRASNESFESIGRNRFIFVMDRSQDAVDAITAEAAK